MHFFIIFFHKVFSNMSVNFHIHTGLLGEVHDREVPIKETHSFRSSFHLLLQRWYHATVLDSFIFYRIPCLDFFNSFFIFSPRTTPSIFYFQKLIYAQKETKNTEPLKAYVPECGDVPQTGIKTDPSKKIVTLLKCPRCSFLFNLPPSIF